MVKYGVSFAELSGPVSLRTNSSVPKTPLIKRPLQWGKSFFFFGRSEFLYIMLMIFDGLKISLTWANYHTVRYNLIILI